MTQSSQPKRGDVLVLVGTRKGGFILSSGPARKQWSVTEPHFSGSEPVTFDSPSGAVSSSGPAGDIFHMAFDPRDGGTIFAAISSFIWGPEIHRSRDYGKTWQSSSRGPRFSDGERTVSNHVSSILDKLHLANRTQAALYALREGLATLETG